MKPLYTPQATPLTAYVHSSHGQLTFKTMSLFYGTIDQSRITLELFNHVNKH